MGLADFWDNITTPGFILDSLDELRHIGKEIKAEAKDLVMEGQEVLSIKAFTEMVILGNDYTTSAEMRRTGQQQLKDIEQRILEERGIRNTSRTILNMVGCEFNIITEALDNLSEEEIRKISQRYQSQFTNLYFEPQTLSCEQIIQQAQRLLKVPDPPAYRPPRDDDSVSIGPISMNVSDKEKRRAAAQEFLKDVVDYKRTCQDIGCEESFNSSVLSDGVDAILLKLADKSWEIRRLPHEENIRGLLLLRAAIYTPVQMAMSHQDDRNIRSLATMIEELDEVDRLTQKLLDDSVE